MSLSDNPFVSFVRCLANKIAHISIHHPFAKEERLDKFGEVMGVSTLLDFPFFLSYNRKEERKKKERRKEGLEDVRI